MGDFRRSARFVAHQPARDINYPLFWLKSAYYHLRAKRIYAYRNAMIKGLANIETPGELFIGTAPMGFLPECEKTLLRVEGKLIVYGWVIIGRGSRVWIAHTGVCILSGCSVTGTSDIIVAHRLEIGPDTRISWGCQFLDADWHAIQYLGRQPDREPGIIIGSHVWIGSRVILLKGARIPSNSVVAAGSVVTRTFDEEGVLIAGNPARIIKHDICWRDLKRYHGTPRH